MFSLIGLWNNLNAPHKRTNKYLVPSNIRIYVVPDIHGCLGLLNRVLEMIVETARTAPRQTRKVVVFLGDYIDRDVGSRAVVDRLLEPMPGFERIFLKGNHEESLLTFLHEPASLSRWMQIGGAATLMSYGVRLPRAGDCLDDARNELLQSMPASHLAFFQTLMPCAVLGDYLFVHAGVRPGVPLDEQTSDDLLWIREPFLSHRAPHEKMIVHGHSIVDQPEFHTNRIALDLGGYATRKTACLILEENRQQFFVVEREKFRSAAYRRGSTPRLLVTALCAGV